MRSELQVVGPQAIASGTTVADLTEQQLIARIEARLPPAPDWMLVGIGDDAAVVEPERNRVEVLTIDALVEGVHFDRRFTPPDAIGHRALAVNLSDLAAMGAAPRLALLSLALPSSLTLEDFDLMTSAVAALAARYRVHVAGGNLTRSPGPLMIDIVAIGTVKRRQALTRAGARPGDEVYVTGTIGAAAAGLQMLKTPGREVAAGCIERYLRPEPRVRVGLLLSRNRAASACIDLSDGLADGLHQIADASGVGIVVRADQVPFDEVALQWLASEGPDPSLQAMTKGDDYELLFTVRPSQRGRLKAAGRCGGVPVTRIGVCTADRALVLRHGIGEAIVDRPLPRGYSHFR